MKLFKNVMKYPLSLLNARVKIIIEQSDYDELHHESIPILPELGVVPGYRYCYYRKCMLLSLIEDDAQQALAKYGAITCFPIEDSKKLHLKEFIQELKNLMSKARLMTRIINKKTVEVYDNPDADSSVWRDDYILAYFIKRLIDIFLKVQDDFPCCFGSDINSRAGLYHYCNQEPEPEENFDLPDPFLIQPTPFQITQTMDEAISFSTTTAQNLPKRKKNEVSRAAKRKKEAKQVIPSPPLTVIKDDIRQTSANGLTYQQVIVNPGHFAHVEYKLFSEKIIDNQYNFIPTQGNKRTLTLLIHILFARGYFNLVIKDSNNKRRKIYRRNVVRFIEKRYNIDCLDATFYNTSTDKAGHQKLERKNYWISRIPYCNLV